jgi:hypothetical protein
LPQEFTPNYSLLYGRKRLFALLYGYDGHLLCRPAVNGLSAPRTAVNARNVDGGARHPL